MRVSAYVSIAAFGTAALSAVVPRQASVITGILSDVGTKIEGVNSAVTAYDGSDSSPLVDAGKTLVSTIEEGITTAKGSEELDLAGALELQDPVKDLTSKASTLVDNLTSKRDTIAKQGECSTTRNLVGDIDSSSNELINTIVAKVPEEAQSIAEGLVADLKSVLAKAKTNFNEANCVDAAGGGSSSAPASSAQPTGGASSAPESSAAPTAQPTGGSSSAPASSAQPTGGASSAPASSAAPTAKPTGGASSAPSATATAVVPPHVTPSGPVVVPTAGAGALLPPGLIAMGIAAALL